jgi:PIF1-like helicase
VGQYSRELASETPLLLNVDGLAGSGKTFTLLTTSARFQELAEQAGKPNPVFRAAPTGIASFNILGSWTLHSLLKLPVKTKKSDLSVATLQALQSLFQCCKFLIIDEKSTTLRRFLPTSPRRRAASLLPEAFACRGDQRPPTVSGV